MRAMMTAICCDRIPTLSGPTRCWCHNWVSAINGHITSLSCREISVNDKKKLDWEWKYGRGAYLSCANACGDNNKNKHSKWREVSHNNVPVIITWQFKIPKQKFPIYQQCTIRRWNKRKTTPNMHTLQLPHTPRRTEKKMPHWDLPLQTIVLAQQIACRCFIQYVEGPMQPQIYRWV